MVLSEEKQNIFVESQICVTVVISVSFSFESVDDILISADIRFRVMFILKRSLKYEILFAVDIRHVFLTVEIYSISHGNRPLDPFNGLRGDLGPTRKNAI